MAGAYRFRMHRGKGVTMEIESEIHLRKDVERLGIAPLTSMYWYSEKAKATAVDWRPEVHDSDGLALWTGAGERALRPLNNPPRTMASSFMDENPRGFGLVQRDREVGHYLDGVFYERRPSLWVETQGNWGKGAVQLIEIPTDDEIHDNIVAMWVPAGPAKAGATYALRYNCTGSPTNPSRAISVASSPRGSAMAASPARPGRRARASSWSSSRAGAGGHPLRREARGRALGLARQLFLHLRRRGRTQRRAAIGAPVRSDGRRPTRSKCAAVLKAGDKVLTETWLYQYLPF